VRQLVRGGARDVVDRLGSWKSAMNPYVSEYGTVPAKAWAKFV
jgi:hypothetical protein